MKIYCQKINEITSNGTYLQHQMQINLENVHVDKLLDEIGLDEIINYYINGISMSKLLDEIGIEYVKEHFNLIEKPYLPKENNAEKLMEVGKNVN